ncbi:DoxX family protein [Halorussus caseinilyticus]|uniref:DoxX family protein n=1 Tax=Halorussus caseinilyticus TaxID=3034025 RepID=UPI0023E75A09|nr:DoxX family protein [Halorussus sp. DT72]
MATDTSKFRTEANVFESDVAGVTVRGKAHSLSAWFVVALRLMMGYAFLHAGWTKITAAEPFDAAGYLTNVTAASPLSGLFHWMGQTGWFVEFVNLAVPWGEFLIGMGLLVGALTRLAAFFGAFMMLLFYFGNWEVSHGLVNGDLAYMMVFLAVAAFGAGRLLGLDALVEKYETGGEMLVERYPKLRYVLG